MPDGSECRCRNVAPANLKLGHCPARMRPKHDVAFAQQPLSGGCAPRPLEPLGARRLRTLYQRFAVAECRDRLTGRLQAASPQSRQKNERILTDRPPQSSREAGHSRKWDAIMTEAVKTALVTGGAKRIGRAIAEDLAAHGFAVAIHCNRSRQRGRGAGRKDCGRSAARAAVVRGRSDRHVRRPDG